MVVTILIEKTETGFSGHMDQGPVFTTGNTIPDFLRNLAEAYELYESELISQTDKENESRKI